MRSSTSAASRERGKAHRPMKGGAKSLKSSKAPNAIALLKADHREVEDMFESFEKSRSADKKAKLAASICRALKVHTAIEEEVFYPAFLEQARDDDLHHEAIVEHQGAKRLIAEIEASAPSDDYFDAKVKVLSEMIKHHVKEEEKAGGMFAEARKADMDLAELGMAMFERKQQLMRKQ